MKLKSFVLLPIQVTMVVLILAAICVRLVVSTFATCDKRSNDRG